MLDSIREIFDILGIQFESVGFHFDKYTQFKQLGAAIEAGKCPVISVPKLHLNPECKEGSHTMVATGVKNKNGIHMIQIKKSYADNSDVPGKFNRFRS